MKTNPFGVVTWWKTLLIVTIALAAVAYVPKLVDPRLSFAQVAEIFVILALAVFGVLGVWKFLDTKPEHKRRLVQQIRSQDPNVAKNAISELNAEGFLADGTLVGANLVGSHLRGIDLKATDKKGAHVPANLNHVNLTQSDLSRADLRGATLIGSKLDRVNFERANLVGADLSHAKFYITNLIGALLIDANLTGAKFAGEVCDETTILPDGSQWNASLDWSRFGAIEELPDFARRVQQTQGNTPQENNPPEYDNDAQRQQDLKLLSRFWKNMHTQNIVALDDGTQYRNLEYDFYQDNFSKYLYERRERAELRFISTIVEEHFEKYDQALGEFAHQLFQAAGVEEFHGRSTVRPNYKQRGLERDVQIYMENEWDKAIDKLLELRRVHDDLVAFLKRKFPEFDFLDQIETNPD